MLTSQRKQYILDVLRRDGQVIAKQVSQALDLSEDTIRRDLRELAAEGLLQRVHGGALPASPAIVDFAGREELSVGGKRAIGRAAAHMIRDGQVVFVDGGTTAVQLARQLPRALRATVVTHSARIAVELVDHPTVEVILIGGRLFKHSIVSVGAAALEAPKMSARLNMGYSLAPFELSGTVHQCPTPGAGSGACRAGGGMGASRGWSRLADQT